MNWTTGNHYGRTFESCSYQSQKQDQSTERCVDNMLYVRFGTLKHGHCELPMPSGFKSALALWQWQCYWLGTACSGVISWDSMQSSVLCYMDSYDQCKNSLQLNKTMSSGIMGYKVTVCRKMQFSNRQLPLSCRVNYAFSKFHFCSQIPFLPRGQNGNIKSAIL